MAGLILGLRQLRRVNFFCDLQGRIVGREVQRHLAFDYLLAREYLQCEIASFPAFGEKLRIHPQFGKFSQEIIKKEQNSRRIFRNFGFLL